MKLYLIRHAQSANNASYTGAEDHVNRVPDPDITELGHHQSQRLANYLAAPGNEPRQHSRAQFTEPDFRLTHLYCSLMTRSIETAQYISRACSLPLVARDDLFERKGLYEIDRNGCVQGVSGPNRDYFKSRFPSLIIPKSLGKQGWWNRPAEKEAEFVLRVESSLTSILNHHEKGHHIALVVHGDYIDQAINFLMKTPRSEKPNMTHWEANWVTHNTSITRVDLTDEYANVVYVNRIDHLDTPLLSW